MIKLKYSSVDGFRKLKSFKTLKAARKYAQEMIGRYPTFGMAYAVSDDGIGKIEVYSGVKLRDLFDDQERDPDAEYEAWENAQASEQAAYEAAQLKAEIEAANKASRARRPDGCTCSEQQLNLVGCDCAAGRN